MTSRCEAARAVGWDNNALRRPANVYAVSWLRRR